MLETLFATEVAWLDDDAVRALSEGAVVKPWTINERTLKPERGGIHCAQIFGPVDDLCCLCTKYRGPEHRDVTCEKCGVLVTDHTIRGGRFGHIEFAMPLKHPWSGLEIQSCLVLPAGLREVAPERIGKKPTGLNALYVELLKRNQAVSRCVEKHAPELLLDHERSLLQDAFDQLLGDVPKHPGRLDKLGARIRRHLTEQGAPDASPFRETLLAAGARVTV